MDYVYAGQLEWVEDCWIASVPAFPGCFGSGESIERAVSAGAEALRLFIADFLDNGEALPDPKIPETPQIVFCVEVDSKFIQTSKCLTTEQAAEELETTPAHISQLVETGELDTVTINGKELITIASANDWSNQHPTEQ